MMSSLPGYTRRRSRAPRRKKYWQSCVTSVIWSKTSTKMSTMSSLSTQRWKSQLGSIACSQKPFVVASAAHLPSNHQSYSPVAAKTSSAANLALMLGIVHQRRCCGSAQTVVLKERTLKRLALGGLTFSWQSPNLAYPRQARERWHQHDHCVCSRFWPQWASGWGWGLTPAKLLCIIMMMFTACTCWGT